MNFAFASALPNFRRSHASRPALLIVKRPKHGIQMDASDKQSVNPLSSQNTNSPSYSPSLSESPMSAPPTSPKTVYFMAIANEFRIASLYRRLLKCKDAYGGIQVGSVGSVLRIAKSQPRADGIAEAFIFSYGCMVAWGTVKDRDDFVSLVVEDALQLRSAPAIDHLKYVFGNTGALRRDIITLQTRDQAALSRQVTDKGGINTNGAARNGSKHSGSHLDAVEMDPVLERLAISCALAQSIKLGAFESALRRTIENTRHLPEELALTGKISASRREVSRLMGQLFLARYRYHLSGDLLMTPAFFWENEMYLPTYNRVERYLEVRERGEVLSKRVEVVQELYKLLGDELTHKNSMTLELAITVMIAFEILLTLITLSEESMRGLFFACALFATLIATGWVLWMLYRRRRRADAQNRLSILSYGSKEWDM